MKIIQDYMHEVITMSRWECLMPQFKYYMDKYRDKDFGDNYYEIPFSDACFGIDKFMEYLEDIGYTIKEIWLLKCFIAYKKGEV